MILHLNRQSFKKFGTIFSEQRGRSDLFEKGDNRQLLQLSRDHAPVFLTENSCRIRPGEQLTVLAAALPGEEYHYFHLDKPVCINAGVQFSLFPARDISTVEIAAKVMPQLQSHRRAGEDLSTTAKLQVKSIYSLFYHEKEQGFFFPGESHAMLELTYVDQGSVHSVADGVDILLEQGEMVIYAPNQWHMQYADIGVAPRYMTITFTASGPLPDCLFNRKLKVCQKALGMLNMMLREQDMGDPYSGDVILNLLSLVLISQYRAQGKTPQRLRTSYSVHNENEIIRRAQQYISSHVRQKLSVPLVSQQVDVSPSYLTSLFHKHLQIAPGEYIRRIKLQESKQMIRENTMNFTQIAAALQYSTVHHFSRQFKEKFGITPSEYARSVR